MHGKLVKIFLFSVVFILAGCSSDQKGKKEQKSDMDKELEVDASLMGDLNKAKQVFYALPSPIETAMLIKRAGTTFDPQYLNPVANVSNYNTNFSKALNFGVYGADLSYASLFSQTQIAIQYMSAAKKLADDLGILGFVDDNIVGRMEKNVNNRDSSMSIITEGFISSSSFLKEAGRPETAALIVSGGWIEGLYIATSLTKNSPNNNELIDRIIDQKLSLVTLLTLLKEFQKNSDIAKVISMIEEIEGVYNKVQIVTSKVVPVTNENSKVTTLQAKTEIFISDEVFDQLCSKIDSIRNQIIGI